MVLIIFDYISIENVDSNKIVVSNKVPFCKMDLNTFLVSKILKN